MSDPERCPTCSERTLQARHLERAGARVHECEVCSGVWVPREVIHELARRTRTDRMPEAGITQRESGRRTAGQQLRLYRACPSCNVLMNRKACGEVVLDVCTMHGVWFDSGELETFLEWVQQETEHHRQILPGAATARAATIAGTALAVTPPPTPEREGSWLSVFDGLDLLEPVAWILEAIFEILSSS